MLIFVPLSDSAYVCMLAVYDIIYLYSYSIFFFFFGFVLEILLRPPSLFSSLPKTRRKKRGEREREGKKRKKIRIYKF